MNKRTIRWEEVETLTADELAEQFKESDLEVCLEPLSEWGSDLEGLFHKLEKGVMDWYEAGLKRSFTICFLDTSIVATTTTEELQVPVPMATPATSL